MTSTATVSKLSEADKILAGILGKIGDPGDNESLKILLYSDPGMGKTTFLGTIPRLLLHDVEDSAFVLRAPLEILKKDTKVLPYTSFYQVEGLVGLLQQNHPEFEQYDVYAIDSMAALHKKGLAEICEREWKKSPLAHARYVAETEDHTENNEHIRRLVDSLKDLNNRHIVITSHVRTVEQKNGSIKTYPDFSEKLSNTLAGMMDIVGYMSVKAVDGKAVRSLRVRSPGLVTCKTRFTNMPDEILDPTWDKLMQYRDEFLASSI